MLNDMEWNEFLKIVLVLIQQHNVHQRHIIQVSLIINLMVCEEKIEEYDVMIIIVLELYETVVLKHKKSNTI